MTTASPVFTGRRLVRAKTARHLAPGAGTKHVRIITQTSCNVTRSEQDSVASWLTGDGYPNAHAQIESYTDSAVVSDNVDDNDCAVYIDLFSILCRVPTHRYSANRVSCPLHIRSVLARLAQFPIRYSAIAPSAVWQSDLQQLTLPLRLRYLTHNYSCSDLTVVLHGVRRSPRSYRALVRTHLAAGARRTLIEITLYWFDFSTSAAWPKAFRARGTTKPIQLSFNLTV